MRAVCLLAALALLPLRAWAQPPMGQDVDQSVDLQLAAAPAGDCVAVAAEGATIVLPRRHLERLVQTQPSQWRTEAERLALIEGRRAQALLGAARPGALAGCEAVVSPPDSEAQSLVLAQLELGMAAVQDPQSGAWAQAVRLRYLGQRCGPRCGRGHMLLYLRGETRPFMVVPWWAS